MRMSEEFLVEDESKRRDGIVFESFALHFLKLNTKRFCSPNKLFPLHSCSIIPVRSEI